MFHLWIVSSALKSENPIKEPFFIFQVNPYKLMLKPQCGISSKKTGPAGPDDTTARVNLPLSVSIVALNEEDRIGRTLASIQDIASEIVVVDAHSSDRTCEIAAAYGASVFQEAWKGHVAQKNCALDKCAQPWILALDCDEVVDDELRRSIIQAVTHGNAAGYILNRKTCYLGKILNHAWQPDLKLRLVNAARNPRWGGYDPHDVLMVEGETRRLQGSLIHYSYRDLSDHMQRMVKYAHITAQSYHQNGKQFRLYKLLLNPVASFVKKYFLRCGFRDGFLGLTTAACSLIYVFMKYYFLWEISHRENLLHLKKKESGIGRRP